MQPRRRGHACADLELSRGAGHVAEPPRVGATLRTLWKTADYARVRRITYVGLTR